MSQKSSLPQPTQSVSLADRAVIIDQGEVVHESTAAELLADTAAQERYCAV